MNIRKSLETDNQRWDGYVHSHAQSTPYHLYAWTNAVSKAYGFDSCRFLAEEHGRIRGILQMVIMKLPFGKVNCIALPYCDVGGVLADDSEIEIALIQTAVHEAEILSANSFEIRGEVDSETEDRCSLVAQSRNNKVRMVLELPNSSELLWDGFKSKLRSQIRKAEKNGLSFIFAENVEAFYSVFSSNMRDLGSPVHSKKWFEEIIDQFGEYARVGLVYCQGKIIAAGIILRVGNSISIPWSSTLRTHNKFSPNMLLYWKFLEYAADNGCLIFDFGRSTLNENTYRFKAQWGALAKELPWRFVYLQGSPKCDSSCLSKNRRRLEVFWKKLPLIVANSIGPQIRRYISL